MERERLRSVFLPRVPHRQLQGTEPLPAVLNMTVLDYWRWAHADVLENVQRGIYAEYLVGAALGITNQVRVGWNPYDLLYGDYKIEVKSSAYLQAWEQTVLSKISFGIGVRSHVDPQGSKALDPRYHADCFVFCVFGNKDAATANVLDAAQWWFYVVPISRLIEYCNVAKSVVENRVKQITNAVSYTELKQRIDETRAGKIFMGEHSNAFDATGPQRVRLKPYAVWERGTRLHPVIVQAANSNDAFLLARADPTLAKLGSAIASQAISKTELDNFLSRGAVDLRFCSDSESASLLRPRERL
jgi:hypothetical protein